jgi:hypothetical protein
MRSNRGRLAAMNMLGRRRRYDEVSCYFCEIGDVTFNVLGVTEDADERNGRGALDARFLRVVLPQGKCATAALESFWADLTVNTVSLPSTEARRATASMTPYVRCAKLLQAPLASAICRSDGIAVELDQLLRHGAAKTPDFQICRLLCAQEQPCPLACERRQRNHRATRYFRRLRRRSDAGPTSCSTRSPCRRC